MKIKQLDHVALHVADVAASCRFYRETLRIEEIPRPDFDFPGAWFRLGGAQELHLIGDRVKEVHSHHRGTHFALEVEDLVAWQSHLTAMSATFLPPKKRPDGATQIFVQDPDGHFVELCEPPSARRTVPS